MDADICGPSLPTILGVSSEQVHSSSLGWSPVYAQDNLAVMSVGFMLQSAKDAVMWRGPKKNGLISQFLKDVDWGELDWLLIDTPPGTSDEHLSVVQYLKESGIDGAVLITTPQEVAIQDVRREINFCRKVNIRILGLVENMSGFVCPNCDTETKIFKPSTGGAKFLASEMGVPFLGSIPLDPRIGKSSDQGLDFVAEYPSSPASIAYINIIKRKFANYIVARGVLIAFCRRTEISIECHLILCHGSVNLRQMLGKRQSMSLRCEKVHLKFVPRCEAI